MEAPSRSQAESLETFELLVKNHRAAFERLARRLTHDAEDAQDLLQETLVDAYRAFHRFRPDSHFYGWVARIMTNNHLDRIRRKYHPTVSLEQATLGDGTETLELPDHSTNPEHLVLHDELDHPIRSALEALQPIHRATVMLCDVEGATYEEAARAEECPVGTIRSRLHRAHKALKDFLAGFEMPAAAPEPEGPNRIHSRRAFLRMGTAAAAVAGAALTQIPGTDEAAAAPETVRVRVWSDGSAPREIYPNGIHGAVADGLRADRHLEVIVVAPEELSAGLSDEALRDTEVLVLWLSETAKLPEARLTAIARRVRHGGMGLIVLHSAADAPLLERVLGEECRWTGERVADGSAVDLRVTAPRHPIAQGVSGFRIAQTERVEGNFAGPKPDVVVFDGRFAASGSTAWQGMVWKAGRGRVFLFEPGHESYPVHFQEEVRKVLRNAARWCAGE